jgi:protein-disulfide isomerase
LLAHQIAMENPAMVLAEGISAQDFYELASEYGVSGVPDTVINGKGRVVGAVPEKQMLSQLMKQFNK